MIEIIWVVTRDLPTKETNEEMKFSLTHGKLFPVELILVDAGGLSYVRPAGERSSLRRMKAANLIE